MIGVLLIGSFYAIITNILLQIDEGKVAKMADLEAVLADVSYLMAMEKSKSTPAARASKKIVLPDPS